MMRILDMKPWLTGRGFLFSGKPPILATPPLGIFYFNRGIPRGLLFENGKNI